MIGIILLLFQYLDVLTVIEIAIVVSIIIFAQAGEQLNQVVIDLVQLLLVDECCVRQIFSLTLLPRSDGLLAGLGREHESAQASPLIRCL